MRSAAIVVGILVVLAIFFFLVGTKDEMTVDRELLLGKWTSTQDTKFTREFNADGTVVDAYQGSSPDAKGNWTLFTKEMPPEGFEGELEEEPIYVAIGMPESEALYFKIVNIDEHSLELVYLNRGGTLSFTR